MKTVMILMMAILVQANTKAADTNVVGLMMASKLSPANHPALAGTAGTSATVATAAINEASKIKRQSETINFIQPEVEPEKKPESLEKPKLNLGRALVNLAFSVWDLFKAIFLVPIQRILSNMMSLIGLEPLLEKLSPLFFQVRTSEDSILSMSKSLRRALFRTSSIES